MPHSLKPSLKNRNFAKLCIKPEQLERVKAKWIPGFVGLYAYSKETQTLYYTHIGSRTLRPKATCVGVPSAWQLSRHGENVGILYADQIEYMIDHHSQNTPAHHDDTQRYVVAVLDTSIPIEEIRDGMNLRTYADAQQFATAMAKRGVMTILAQAEEIISSKPKDFIIEQRYL